MSTQAARGLKLAVAIKAYGMELRLWKESGERQWGSSLREGDTTVESQFEEDNLALAKLHVLAEARSRAVTQSGKTELPGCDTLLDSWKPINIAKP